MSRSNSTKTVLLCAALLISCAACAVFFVSETLSPSSQETHLAPSKTDAVALSEDAPVSEDDTPMLEMSALSEDDIVAMAPHSFDMEVFKNSPSRPADIVLKEGAALAVVVDDCGGDMDLAERLAACRLPLTWAVIPGLRYSRSTADMLIERGVPFLIHMPMQAIPDPDGQAGQTGKYRIGRGMSERAVQDALEPVLNSYPEAYGLNNHRGSKATEDLELMMSVMNVLAEHRKFFLDSSTTRDTVAYRAALACGLDALRNNIFLDNESNREIIRARFEEAISLAMRRGSAVAICHLRPETIAFLVSVDEDLFTSKGVRLVTLPQLVELRRGMER